MAAHRYWRAIGLEAYGFAGLEITEFHLLAGTARVDASATLTSNIAPTAGALANLKDDNTATGATWDALSLKALVLNWDFGGSPQDVTNIVIGAAVDPVKFPLIVGLQYSDDTTTWTVQAIHAGIEWPGVRTKTASAFRAAYDPYDPLVTSRSDFSTGSLLTDERAASWSASGAAAIVVGGEPFGSGLLQIGAAGFLSRPYVAALHEWWAGAYTAECYVKYAAWPSSGRNLFGSYSPETGVNDWAFGATSSGALELFYWTGAVQFVTQVAPTMSLDTWHHVALQFEPGTPGTIKLFIDTVLVASAPLAGTPATSVMPFIIGRAAGVDLNAKVKAFRITAAARYPALPQYAFGDYIRLNRVRGRTQFPAPVVVPSAMSIPITYGTTRGVSAVRGRRDYLTGVLGQGIGRVKGTTKDKGTPSVPVSERVRLYRERDGMLMREAWSAPGTGDYSFDYVDEMQTYTVISYDHDKNFRAVVADGLTLANGGVEVIA